MARHATLTILIGCLAMGAAGLKADEGPTYPYYGPTGGTAVAISDQTVDDGDRPTAVPVQEVSLAGSLASCSCDPVDCDCETTQTLKAAAASAHKVLFYDNDFEYICDPCYCDWHLGDGLKRRCIGNCWTLDVGGQYRARQHSERNMRGLGLTGVDDDFLLHRTRLYLNAEYGSRIRFYAEMIDALSVYENFAPRPIEENRADIQNLFVDVVAWEGCCRRLTARVGRQEILYGAERLASPLDWANTRRTFEGAKLMWEGQNWDVDAFWVRPMRRELKSLDPPNLDQEWYGIYSTYKGLCRDKLELFWFALDFHDVGFRYDTLGTRYWGERGDWLYELEGGVQFGDNADGSDHSAGYVTSGLGRKFPCSPLKPAVWFFYDWASGDNTVNNGFHHNFPLAHKYNGFMDLFGRRNLHDVNVQATGQLCEKVKLLFWYHYFRLANGNDVPYNVNMTPFAGLTAGSAGSKDLGHEIDFIASYSISPRSDLLFGYSHFFAGDFYATTPGVPYDGDADFFYTQLTVDF